MRPGHFTRRQAKRGSFSKAAPRCPAKVRRYRYSISADVRHPGLGQAPRPAAPCAHAAWLNAGGPGSGAASSGSRRVMQFLGFPVAQPIHRRAAPLGSPGPHPISQCRTQQHDQPTFIVIHIQPPASPLIRDLRQSRRIDSAGLDPRKLRYFGRQRARRRCRSATATTPTRDPGLRQKERPPGGGPGGLLRGGDRGAGGLR